tara:strand:- start:14 stop:181 length:168 start_codon:yes stop_codon:yes gene_type:complete
MPDQTRPEIMEVQLRNKIKAKVDQNKTRQELKDFISNCSVHDLQKMNDLRKVLEK